MREMRLSAAYRFKKEEWEGISAQLSRIALFRFVALQVDLMQCINKHNHIQWLQDSVP